jgi:hypothetical protein
MDVQSARRKVRKLIRKGKILILGPLLLPTFKNIKQIIGSKKSAHCRI